MPLLRQCCCINLRKGSFVSGVYTLVLQGLMMSISVISINSSESKEILGFTIGTVVMSLLCVITSALMLVGLCVDKKTLLLPWLISVSLLTAFNVILMIYIFQVKNEDAMTSIIFSLIDALLCGFNVLGMLCVISQYQEYSAGRGTAAHAEIYSQSQSGRKTDQTSDEQNRNSESDPILRGKFNNAIYHKFRPPGFKKMSVDVTSSTEEKCYTEVTADKNSISGGVTALNSETDAKCDEMKSASSTESHAAEVSCNGNAPMTTDDGNDDDDIKYGEIVIHNG